MPNTKPFLWIAHQPIKEGKGIRHRLITTTKKTTHKTWALLIIPDYRQTGIIKLFITLLSPPTLYQTPILFLLKNDWHLK